MNEETKPNKRTRGPNRVIRIEDDQEVAAWCEAFTERMEGEIGFLPTRAQALEAWFVKAKTFMGGVGA